MTTKPITQREARALKARVAELERREENRRGNWFNDYPGGHHIGSHTVSDITAAKIRTARLLKHAVVVTNGNVGELNFYALPLAKDTDA
jgi:hypothetical protein